jgi:hypothetical protein
MKPKYVGRETAARNICNQLKSSNVNEKKEEFQSTNTWTTLPELERLSVGTEDHWRGYVAQI